MSCLNLIVSATVVASFLRKIFVTLVCCTMLMVLAATAETPQQIKADPGNNNPPPPGAILDLNGTPIPAPGNYQQYTVNFIASLSNTAITFALRDDPAFIELANVSVREVADGVEPSFGPNLLTNSDFSAGTVGSNTPVGWIYANIYGATFGGIVEAGSRFCFTLPYCYYDGAVQAYDAISQTIPTTVGHNYQISFYLTENSGCGCNFSRLSTNNNTTDTGGNGIDVAVYALGGLPPAAIASQTIILQPGVQAMYSFDHNQNKYKLTPSPYSTGGESLTISEVLVPQSAFIPPANFPTETCTPVEPFSSSLGTPICVEYQADCSVGGQPGGGDCNTLLYTLLESYDLPSTVPAIGGPDFLVVHGKGCPTSGADHAVSIFTDYVVTRIDPTIKGSGSGTGSCFEVMYTPGAPLITSGGTSRFIGWQTPIVDSALNQVKAGSARPLIFTWNDSAGNPITNLSYCNSFNTSNVCTDSPTVNPPWVNLADFQVACPGQAAINNATDVTITESGNSGFQNIGGGNYQANWKTLKSWKGSCFNIRATFDNGVVLVPATLGFQFN